MTELRMAEVHHTVLPMLDGHNLEAPVHDDLQASTCRCRANHAVFVSGSGEVFDPVADIVSRPPINTALPDGGVCFKCGGMTVRTGTCTGCTSCGEQGGCG